MSRQREDGFISDGPAASRRYPQEDAVKLVDSLSRAAQGDLGQMAAIQVQANLAAHHARIAADKAGILALMGDKAGARAARLERRHHAARHQRLEAAAEELATKPVRASTRRRLADRERIGLLQGRDGRR